jgi:hypothetical protein
MSLKFRHSFQNSLLLVPVVSHVIPVYALVPVSVFPNLSSGFKSRLPANFPHQPNIYFSRLHHTCHITFHFHPPWFNHRSSLISDNDCKFWSCSLWEFFKFFSYFLLGKLKSSPLLYWSQNQGCSKIICSLKLKFRYFQTTEQENAFPE